MAILFHGRSIYNTHSAPGGHSSYFIALGNIIFNILILNLLRGS